MWLDKLKELKKNKGMSTKQIAEKTDLPERTIARIFSGETDNPYVDTLRRIVSVLGGSLDDIFAESKTVVANQNLITLQAEVDRLTAENERLTAENTELRHKNIELISDNATLNMKLGLQEETISLYRIILNLTNLSEGKDNNKKSPLDQ